MKVRAFVAYLCVGACGCVAAGLALPVPAAEPAREIHGSADVFSAPGVALAWGVLRGANDATTTVVLRVAIDPAVFAAVAAMGRDPFTQQTKPLLPTTPTARTVDLRVVRAHFADFPRTELRLYGWAAQVQSDVPKLVVFYLGVPDTTPDFVSETALETYLAERIAHAPANPGSKPP